MLERLVRGLRDSPQFNLRPVCPAGRKPDVADSALHDCSPRLTDGSVADDNPGNYRHFTRHPHSMLQHNQLHAVLPTHQQQHVNLPSSKYPAVGSCEGAMHPAAVQKPPPSPASMGKAGTGKGAGYYPSIPVLSTDLVGGPDQLGCFPDNISVRSMPPSHGGGPTLSGPYQTDWYASTPSAPPLNHHADSSQYQHAFNMGHDPYGQYNHFGLGLNRNTPVPGIAQQQQPAATMVSMSKREAWARFTAYEGCLQVCR